MIAEIWKTGFLLTVWVLTVSIILIMFRRAWISYWDYVNGIDFVKIDDSFWPYMFDWDNIVNNNSPWAFFHLLVAWVVYVLLALAWPLTLPVAIVISGSGYHKRAIARKKEFEQKLKGNKQQT